MTERLYLSDPELTEFEAQVAARRMLGGHPAVMLDRTAFYPEGGGQPADRGEIAGIPVLDVQEVDGEILHALAAPAPDGRVRGRIDPVRRLDHVQQHHGQHLLSAAFEALRGARTLSFHLGEETCTIDLDVAAAALDETALREVEAAANAAVFRDLPVTARELGPDELARLPLRKEPVKGTRVVVVGALPEPGEAPAPGAVFDASPCGGTHPRRTGTVGAIAVLRAQKWGSGARVEFVCGARVLRAFAESRARVAGAAAALRCAPVDVAAAAARLADEAATRRKDLDRLVAVLAAVEAERLAVSTVGAIRASLAPPAPGAAAWLRAVGSALAERGRVALLGAVENGRAYLCFARPGGPGPHLGERLRAAAARLGGKGGGAPELAQGSGSDPSALEAALAEAERALDAPSASDEP